MQQQNSQPSSKCWARLRLHGPCFIFDWHETEQQARDAITESAAKHGDQVYKFQTVAFFPDKFQQGEATDIASMAGLIPEEDLDDFIAATKA